MLLVIQPNEPVSTSACPQSQQQHQPQPQHPQKPPPYVGPPQVQTIHEDYPYQMAYDNRSPNNKQHPQQNYHHHHQPYHNHHHHQQPPSMHHMIDPYHQLIYEKSKFRQPVYSNYTENQKLYAQQLHNQGYDKGQQQQQFYTLPNRRPQREVVIEPPRSITPDITRGLARGPLSSMHMMARQGQKSSSAEKLVSHHHAQPGYNCQMDLNRKNLEQFDARCKYATEQQQRQMPVDVKNR